MTATRPVRAPSPPPTLRPNAATSARVLSIAGALAASGVRAGDRVLLRRDNDTTFPLLLLALCHLDTSIVLADAELSEAQSAELRATARVRRTVGDDSPGGDIGPDPDPDRLGDGPSMERWSRRSDAVVLWSSGTTGPPRAVVRSGRAVLDNCRTSVRALGYRRDDVLMPLLPFTHQYGLSVLIMWWLAGCGLQVAPYRRLDRAFAEGAERGVTIVDGPGVVYDSLLRLARRRPALLPSLRGVRMWCVGGAPLPPELAQRFRAATGHPLLDGYGSTELGNVALATSDNPHGCGPALPGVGLRVVDDDGAPVPAGTRGGILVRSPGRMQGYLGSDGGLGEVPEWFPTGDVGHLDVAGNLHVAGRRRAVHRMGHTLDPHDLERRAARCGAPVTMVTVPDGRRGATLVCFVLDPVGDPGAWRRRIDAELSTFERPNHVVVLPAFPRRPNGKVDMTTLRALAARRVQS